MPRPKPTPARKASGENIEEWQRHGCKVQFRISDLYADRLEGRAREAGVTANQLAKMLLQRELHEPGDETEAEMRDDARADAELVRQYDEDLREGH